MRKYFFILIILVLVLSCKDDKASGKKDIKKSRGKIENFTNEELSAFQLVKNYYKDFNYSDTYTETCENGKVMIFQMEKNLYFDQYISYASVYYPDEKMITYSFDAGTSYRGSGAYFIIDNETVISVQKSGGTSAYGYEIYKNGTKTDEMNKAYNFYKDRMNQ
jgi:hypothetical protein